MKSLACIKCYTSLGEMERGKIRKGAVLLCANCWGKAEIAITIADMAAQRYQKPDFKGSSDKDKGVVENLMGLFGMK